MKVMNIIISLLLMMATIVSSCARRDCQGHKHKVKTEMGGYL
jgi:hypothetical protein